MDWWRRWELMDDYEGFCVLCSLYSNNSNAQAEVLKCKTFCVEPVDKARRILQEVSISCVDKSDHHFVYGLSCKYDCRCAYDKIVQSVSYSTFGQRDLRAASFHGIA